MNFAGGGSTRVVGQLMFQELETGEKFVLIVYLNILDSGDKGQGTEIELQYHAMCTIVELDRNAPSPSLDESISAPFGDWTAGIFENKAFLATSALDGGFIAQATLSREDFLERTGFILTVQLRWINNENTLGEDAREEN